jgi:HEAT repeat protein
VDPEIARTEIVQRFAVAQTIEGGDKTLRESAVRVLTQDIETMGASGAPAYLPILTVILRSREAELRLAAADSIGMIGPTAAETPELTRLLNDPVPGVAAAARRALAERPLRR